MKSKIESLLFVSTRPLTAKAIYALLKKQEPKIKVQDIEDGLRELFDEYNAAGRGISLVESNGQYQMVTAAANTELMKKFLREERTGELSQPSLETLTIVAYRGPAAKPHIEQIRGVNCSLILRNLLIRGLVCMEEVNGSEVYAVTPDFLKYLGLTSVEQLPDYEKLHVVENLEEFLKR